VKAAGPEQGVYVRVGSTNRRADPAQIEEIKRFVRGGTFDEEPLPEMNTETIDFRAASECFSSVRKLRKSDLRILQITAIHQNHEIPTVGGFLLFGRDRRETFPDAYIRAGCFSGVDKNEIIDSVEIVGYLPLLVEDVLKFIQRNTRHAIRVESTKHAES
jgi:ATP-dependent DNA helicase RecG